MAERRRIATLTGLSAITKQRNPVGARYLCGCGHEAGGGEMKAERLAEIRKFAVETIPNILKQKREPQTERALFSTGPALLELIDALTAERARADELEELATQPLQMRMHGFEETLRGYKATFEHPLNQALAEVLVDTFRGAGGVNFLELRIVDGRDWERYTLLIQRSLGATPAELHSKEKAARIKAEKQRDEILRLGSPYPLTSILEILPVAINHLLGDHGCDHHGYETWMAASQAAIDLRSELDQIMENGK